MSVTPHWPSAVRAGFDSQEQYPQLSQAANASLSPATVYTPPSPHVESYPSKQFNNVEAHQQQIPLVQQSYFVSQTQPISTTHNPQPVSQGVLWEGQYYQPQLLSTNIPELSKTSAESSVTYQPQQASSMAGVYYSSSQQQQMLLPLVYRAQQPTLSFQNSEIQLQSSQLNPMVYNAPQQSSGPSNQQGHSSAANLSHTQSVLNKLIGHETCVHTLNYLEAQVEKQKQIGKSQSEQLKTLLEQLAQQKKEIKRLKLDCTVKDRSIEELRSQIDVRKYVESLKDEVPGLRAVIKEQREELERLHLKRPIRRVMDRHKLGGHVTTEKRSLIGRHNKNVEKLGDDISRLNINQCELSRLQKENQTLRLDIGRLERENSEFTKLRIEVLELNRKLRETRPLLKISAALGQSDLSTGPGERDVVEVRGTQ